MRIMSLILLGCFGYFMSAEVLADVSSVYFQFNQDGEIVDMGSTGVDTQEGNTAPDGGKSNVEEETKSESPVMMRGVTKGADATPNACTEAGGEGTTDSCVCPDGGEAITYIGTLYCCKNGFVWSVSQNAYQNLLVPQCGCNADTTPTLYTSFRTGTDGEHVCCSGHDSYISTSVVSSSIRVSTANDPLCGCPLTLPDGKEVKDKTKTDDLTCCVGSSLLQLSDGVLLPNQFGLCGCSDRISACTTQQMCEEAMNDYGKNWYWCDADNTCKEGPANQTVCPCASGYARQADGACVPICSDAHLEECATQEACEAGTHRKWCYTDKNCKWDCNGQDSTCQSCDITNVEKACKSGDSCCPSGQQQFVDGKCYNCPVDGELRLAENEVICCQTGISGRIWEYETDDTGTQTFVWRWDPEGMCGCPKGGTIPEGADICCRDNYGWNSSTEDYDSVSEFCGCPDGGVISASGGCCKSGRPINDEGTYSAVRDVEQCGCLEGETMETVFGDEDDEAAQFCCRAGDIQAVSPSDTTLKPKNNICYCNEGDKSYYSFDKGVCAMCLEDSHCTSSATPRCLIDGSNPANNKCVACLSSGADCPSSAPVCNAQNECESCSSGYYQNGHCYECLNNTHCLVSPNTKCDTTTHQCAACVPSQNSPNTGCDIDAPWCVQIGSNRFCSICRTDSDCSGGKKCRFRSVGDSKVGVCVSTECTQDRDCRLFYPRDKEKCDLNTQLCVANCTGTVNNCKCPTDLPVWDIYSNKCVKCYDSISEDWTDLGCPETETEGYVPWDVNTYDPRALVNNDEVKRICLVTTQIPSGKCVACLKDSHCTNGAKCIGNVCKCDSDEAYSTTHKLCVKCTANYGRTTTTATTIACPSLSIPYCDQTTGTCYECDANYGVSDKHGCPRLNRPLCDTEKRTCSQCPSATPLYSETSHKCVACDSNSTLKDGKCFCKAGYGVVMGTKQCVDAKTASIAATATTNCAQKTSSQTIFEFTPVSNMLYRLTFSGVVSYDDWAKFTCEGAILDKTTSSGTGRTTKKWCSNNRDRDTNPNDDTYCNSEARATKTTAQDKVDFLGDGKKCTFTVTNGHGGYSDYAACSFANVGSYKGGFSVEPLNAYYTP